jgi:hypothetical protein
MVLLKNSERLLPLDPALKRIALIGPLADDHHHILGCWYRIGRDEDTESVLDGLRAVLPTTTELTHLRGCDLEGREEPDLEGAAQVARDAELAILVLGEGEHMSGEAHSRAYLGLPGHQQALLETVQATGVPLVVVLMSGRPLVIPWMAEHVPAILQAWHGGIRAGRAVADLVVGATDPSAKLTAKTVITATSPTRVMTRPHIQCTKRVIPLINIWAGRLRLMFLGGSDGVRLTRPKILADSVGITVIETNRLKTTALLMAMAMSRNSCPASSCTKTMGRNTATVVSVLARTAPQTSTAPS